MVTLSNEAIAKVAREIEPHVRLIHRSRPVTHSDITFLARHHASHNVSSERTVRMIGEILEIYIAGIPDEGHTSPPQKQLSDRVAILEARLEIRNRTITTLKAAILDAADEVARLNVDKGSLVDKLEDILRRLADIGPLRIPQDHCTYCTWGTTIVPTLLHINPKCPVHVSKSDAG